MHVLVKDTCLIAPDYEVVRLAWVLAQGTALQPAGLAGAVSRTATAPVDRLKMLLQVQDGAHAMTIRDGIRQMAAEGGLQLH